MTPAGLPHSEIPGSTVVCTSPRLIAAYHVLHRFPEPRHPPYALICLTSISSSPRAQTRHSPAFACPSTSGHPNAGVRTSPTDGWKPLPFPPTRLVRFVKEPPGARHASPRPLPTSRLEPLAHNRRFSNPRPLSPPPAPHGPRRRWRQGSPRALYCPSPSHPALLPLTWWRIPGSNR